MIAGCGRAIAFTIVLVLAAAASSDAQEKGGPEEIPEGPGEFLASGGPDPFGYRFADNNPSVLGCGYNFIDIGSSGTAIGTGDDTVFANIPIGFSFDYYGSSYTTTNVSTNGYLAFGSTNSSFSNTCPMPVSLNDRQISAFWDDLYVFSPASLRYATVGSAPNRVFVVQWDNAFFCCDNSMSAPNLTFQIQLFETSNIIAFMYADVQLNSRTRGSSATIGIDGPTSSNFLQYSCNNESLSNGRAVFFLPPGVEACGDTLLQRQSVPAVQRTGWVVLAVLLLVAGSLLAARRAALPRAQ